MMVDRFEVLFFLPQLGGGGAEMNAVRLAPGLVEAGISPVYAVTRGPGSYAHLLPENVELIVLDTGNINSSTLRLIRSRRPLAQLIDERRPDVVCPVMAKTALACFSALRRAQYIPSSVLSIQNSLSVSHEKNPTLFNRIELHFIRRWFPSFHGAVALSNGVSEELKRIVPEFRDRVVMVPNVGLPLPVQMSKAMRVDRPSSSSEITLLACGRLTRQKDYPTLFRAFAQLSGSGLRLNILGDGDLRKELVELVQDLGIADRVAFLGFQSDPFYYMRLADIFVLSSRWEGFGNVLVEAMAMGTPVVSTNCPHGPAEIIDDGRNGFLVPTEAPDALAVALQRLIDDSALRLKIGRAGQIRAQDFSTTQIGSLYAQYFRDIADQSKLRVSAR